MSNNSTNPYFALQEAIFLLLALGILYYLSTGFGVEIIAGRSGRYNLDEAGFFQLFQLFPKVIEKGFITYQQQQFHARWLIENCGRILCAFGIVGWLVLTIGRRCADTPRAGARWLWFLVMCLIWGLVYAWIRWRFSSALTVAFLVAISALFVVGRHSRDGRTWQSVTHPLIYPLFVFLSGLGWLWLIDYSSQSHLSLRWIAIYRCNDMLLAFALITSLAGFMADINLFFIRKVFFVLDSDTKNSPIPLWIPLFISLAVGVWVIYIKSPTSVSTLSELLRDVVFLIVGWLMLRWRETHGWERWWRPLLSMFLLALAFAFLKDMGQIFTGLLAIGFFGLGMFFISRGDRNIRASIFAGIVVVALMLYQLPSVGPVLSALGHTHIEERIELIAPDHEFKGGKEYLSLLRWFMRDAPALGFGLGHVPWCGTVQLSDTKCDGLEAQSQSDYVFAVLAGVFGQFFAWLILGATALFLLLLVRRTSLRPDHPYYFSQLYGNYVVRAFFIVSIFQLFVTSLGSVGALPLTGITFPLLSYGGASLMGVSFFTALVINRMPEKIKRG